MAFTVAGIVGVCLLLAVTNGKFTPDANQMMCNDTLKNDYLSDNTYCEMFYRCSAGQKHNISCPAGLLFDPDTNCNYPANANCPHWPCSPDHIGAKYPCLCKDKYFECTNLRFVLMTCPPDTHFNMTDGQCVAGAGMDHPLCLRNNGTKNDSQMCNNFPHLQGDVCQYRTKTGNNTYTENMPCPETLAFNATSCNCDVPNTSCPKPTVMTRSKLPDTQCRASYDVKFEEYNNVTGKPKIFCEKDNAFIDYFLDSYNVQFSAGSASLSADHETGAEPYLHAYNYNNNQLTPSIGMCLTFKLNGPTTAPVHLFTNNYADSCTPTIDMTATLSADNTYTVNVNITAMTRYSVTNTTTASGTLSASLAVGAGNYFEACVLFTGMINLKLTDRGADGATKGATHNQLGVATLGSTILPNKCGLMIAKGAHGTLKRIHIYEGCRNNELFFSR
jgi:hypothetical protein